MDSAAPDHLFRNYWRIFLPLWLVPLPVLAAVLFADLASSNVARGLLPYVIVGILAYFIIAEIRVLAPWRRGEITYSQSWILSTPFGAVAILCFLLHSVLFQLFRP